MTLGRRLFVSFAVCFLFGFNVFFQLIESRMEVFKVIDNVKIFLVEFGAWLDRIDDSLVEIIKDFKELRLDTNDTFEISNSDFSRIVNVEFIEDSVKENI